MSVSNAMNEYEFLRHSGLETVQGGETVRLLVDSIKIMRSSSALASFLSEQLQKVSAPGSSSKSEDGMFVDVARQLQTLCKEGRALMLQLDPDNAESLAQTLAESSRTSPVARHLFLELLENASAKEKVVEEVVEKIVPAAVAEGIETQVLPSEDAGPVHLSIDQLDQLEYSAISARSSMASFTPAREARKGASSSCHSPASVSILPQRRQESLIAPQMRSLGGANNVDLYVEMLKQNLGDISLAKKVPRQKADGRATVLFYCRFALANRRLYPCCNGIFSSATCRADMLILPYALLVL